MADPFIQATTSVDTSGLKAGMAESVADIQRQLALMKEQYKQASAEVRQSVNRIVDAEKQATEAIAAGHAQLAQNIKVAVAQDVASIDELIAKQTQAAASVKALEEQLKKMSDGASHSVTDVQAASAAIRSFEGSVPIRAVEQFTVKMLGLGPIMQAAFPVIGAVVFGEVLVRAGEKVYEFTERFNPLTQAEKRATEATAELAGKVKQLADEARRLSEANLEQAFGSIAGAANKATNISMLDLPKTEAQVGILRNRLQGLEADKAKLDAAFARETNGNALSVIDNNRKAVAKDIETLTHELSAAMLQVENLKQKAQAEAFRSAQAQLDENQRAAEARTEAAKKATEKYKQQTAQNAASIREGYRQMLDDLKLDHQLTVNEEIQFAERELAEVAQLGSRYKALQDQIRNELATLQQRKFAEDKRAHDKELEEEDRHFLQQLHNQLEHARIAAEAAKREAAQQRREAEQQRAETIADQQAESIGRIARLDLQRSGIQQAQALDVTAGPAEKVEYLRQLKEIDRQIIEEKLQQKAREIQIDSLNDPKKAAQDIKQLAEIQRAGQIQLGQDTVRIYTEMEAAHRRYVQQVERGVSSMVTGWLTGHQTLLQGLRSIYQQMLGDFTQMIAQRVFKWVEGTVAVQAAESGMHAALRALHLEAAVATQTEDAASGEAQVNTAAAVGGANAAAATAAIPIVGPELAPEAGAAMYATILGAYAGLAAFETGGYVPQTGIAMLHKGEEVVNSPMRAALMDLLQSGGQGGSFSMGDIHVHPPAGSNPQDIADQVWGTIQSKMRRNNMTMAGAR